MATTKTLNVTLVTRNDTAENWASSTYILKKGEMGLDTTNNILKAGDGINVWPDLPALNECKATTASHYEVTANADESDADAITRALDGADAKNDDICVVKHLIASDKYSYTAYVYNGTAWAAFDGNYDADNIYFDEDLIATKNIGVIEVGSSGSTTIAAEGKSLEAVLKSILAKEINPTKTLPAVSFSSVTFGSYEAGSNVIPSYSATLSAGSYTYGPATGITATAWSVVNSNGDTKDTASASFDQIQVVDDTNYTITATATYGDGAIPVTNLGNEYADAQITASTASKTSSAITSYRQVFYGMSDNTDALDSAAIRALLGKTAKNYTATQTLSLKAESVTNAVRGIVAIPTAQITGSRTGVSKVIMPSAMNADTTATWVKQDETVDVEGANGYDAVSYTIWIYQPAKLDSTETYTITLA